jgi:hypothetical protein
MEKLKIKYLRKRRVKDKKTAPFAADPSEKAALK